MAVKKGGRTYSTGPAGVLPAGFAACRRCGAWPCRCEPQASAPPASQSPRVRRDRAGRGGKTVTTLGPLVLSREDAVALLAELKRTCSAGGALEAVKGPDGPHFVLEVQGDHVDRVLDLLLARGYKAKRAGG